MRSLRLAALVVLVVTLWACLGNGADEHKEEPVIEGPRTKQPVAPRAADKSAAELPKAPEYREGDAVRVMPDLRETPAPGAAPPAAEKPEPGEKRPAKGDDPTPESDGSEKARHDS